VQPEPQLLSLQRRFMAALREPIFGESRERSELPARTGTVSPEFVRTADALITPSATLQPVERLELYHRQYWYRLLDSIAEDFPALRQLVGDEPFWRLMEAYLEAVPPRSFTLRHLGAGLARFIALRPDAVPHPVHAEDLARLEYALCLAFEAGQGTPIQPAELGQGELGLQPNLELLALRTPADTLWRLSEKGKRLPEPGQPSGYPNRFVAVYRYELSLHVERLPRAAFSILAAIGELGSLDLAMQHVTGRNGLLRASDAGRVAKWFGLWTARGWFTRTAHQGDRPTTQRRKPWPRSH
jgi:hypothetical protein